MAIELPVMAFRDRRLLRQWLVANHRTSGGIYVRLYKRHSGIASVTFEDVLDEGLCFGWSENKRLPYDEQSYLQRFTPRAGKGTASERNIRHARQLIADGLMTPAGLAALGDIGNNTYYGNNHLSDSGPGIREPRFDRDTGPEPGRDRRQQTGAA